MRVCLDTNVFLRIFSQAPAYLKIQRALISGRIRLVLSNDVLLEYQEVVVSRSRHASWPIFELFIARLEELGHLFRLAPSFRFQLLVDDPDDNKFSDCAIVGEAEFLVTYDRHFDALRGSGYKPQPITPEKFVQLLG